MQGIYAWKLTCFCRFFFHFLNFVHFIPRKCRFFSSLKCCTIKLAFCRFFWRALAGAVVCLGGANFYLIIFICLSPVATATYLPRRKISTKMTRQCREVPFQYSDCHVTATSPWMHRLGKMTGECRAPKVGIPVGIQIQQSTGPATDSQPCILMSLMSVYFVHTCIH